MEVLALAILLTTAGLIHGEVQDQCPPPDQEQYVSLNGFKEGETLFLGFYPLLCRGQDEHNTLQLNVFSCQFKFRHCQVPAQQQRFPVAAHSGEVALIVSQRKPDVGRVATATTMELVFWSDGAVVELQLSRGPSEITELGISLAEAIERIKGTLQRTLNPDPRLKMTLKADGEPLTLDPFRQLPPVRGKLEVKLKNATVV